MDKGWHEKAQATAERNRSGIDFSVALDADVLDEGPKRRSTWVTKMHELADAVRGGHGEVGKFYLLGEFTSKGGARTTISNLQERLHDLPPGVELDLRAVKDGDGSQLWGAVTKIKEE